jgi:hypothetical protein
MEPSQPGLGRLHFDKKPVAILKVFAEGSGSPQKIEELETWKLKGQYHRYTILVAHCSSSFWGKTAFIPLGIKKPVALGCERWQVGIFQCSLMHQDPSSFASWDTNRTRSGGSKSAD